METEKKKWYKKWWGVILIIIILFFFSSIFAFVLFVINSPISNTQLIDTKIANNSIDQATKDLIEGSDNYWIGAGEPTITIVEFSDFACSYCKNSFPVIREVGLKYRDKIKHIYRDFPALGETSVNLALAARCAGEQGLFWPMHDKIFQSDGLSLLSEFLELANQIGADTSKFERCYSQKKYLKLIQNDFLDGEALGVNGTPTWFINGQKVEGDIPLNIFIQIIEELIKKQ